MGQWALYSMCSQRLYIHLNGSDLSVPSYHVAKGKPIAVRFNLHLAEGKRACRIGEGRYHTRQMCWVSSLGHDAAAIRRSFCVRRRLTGGRAGDDAGARGHRT